MFTSILSDQSSTLTLANALLCAGASVICGLLISVTYMFSGKYRKGYVLSLALLPVLVQVVIMMVNGNLGVGVATMGAFSLIRFRSAPGNARDICAIFASMAVGIATGMGYITFAVGAAVIFCVLFFVLSRTPFGEKRFEEKELKITIPEDLDYTSIFDDLFDKYTSQHSLETVKTTNMGSMYQLTYLIHLKDAKLEKDFIDGLRARNGNLTIVCSREKLLKEEL